MKITKAEVSQLIEEMPDPLDLEELQYRLYLHQKLKAAEEDIRTGRTLTHDEVVQETAGAGESMPWKAR